MPVSTRRTRALGAAVLASVLFFVAAPGAALALPPEADPHFVQVDAGRFGHAVLGLTDDGILYSWGTGFYGELGDGSSVVEKLTPTPIALPALAAGDKVIQVSVGSNHVLAVTAQGAVLVWGANSSGQLGLGDITTRYAPTVIPTSAFPGLAAARIVAVSASGSDHSLALSSSGQVFAWGWNGFGQVGDNSFTDRLSPVRVINNSATAISAGNGYSFAVTSAGVYSWGYNGDGRLGNNSTTTRTVPTATSAFPSLAMGERIVEVATGLGHGIAVSSAGKVYTWGDDGSGQLGLGAGDNSRRTPARVTMPVLAAGDSVVSVDAGDSFSLARTALGALYAWGYNDDGSLGLGDNLDRQSPTVVNAFPSVLDEAPITWISAGDTGTVIVSSTGGVYGTGYFGGLLGDETAADYPVASFTNIRLGDLAGTASVSPAPVDGVTVSAIATGWNAGAVYTYQWQRDGSDIPSATDATYDVTEADAGHVLRVVISATAENYRAGSATSIGATVAAAIPEIQTLALPSVTAGDALTLPIVATGTGPLAFSGVTLPAGLSIDPASGVISGSITVAGDYPVQIQVSNDAGVDNGYYTLSVTAGAVTTLTLTPSTTTPNQGDTIAITALGYDAFDNLAGNLTATTVFTSDVATDVIVGNEITFPHASPHTITAVASGLSQSLVIQVTPLPSELATTGGVLSGWIVAVAVVVVFLGIGTVTLVRLRGRFSH